VARTIKATKVSYVPLGASNDGSLDQAGGGGDGPPPDDYDSGGDGSDGSDGTFDGDRGHRRAMRPRAGGGGPPPDDDDDGGDGSDESDGDRGQRRVRRARGNRNRYGDNERWEPRRSAYSAGHRDIKDDDGNLSAEHNADMFKRVVDRMVSFSVVASLENASRESEFMPKGDSEGDAARAAQGKDGKVTSEQVKCHFQTLVAAMIMYVGERFLGSHDVESLPGTPVHASLDTGSCKSESMIAGQLDRMRLWSCEEREQREEEMLELEEKDLARTPKETERMLALRQELKRRGEVAHLGLVPQAMGLILEDEDDEEEENPATGHTAKVILTAFNDSLRLSRQPKFSELEGPHVLDASAPTRKLMNDSNAGTIICHEHFLANCIVRAYEAQQWQSRNDQDIDDNGDNPKGYEPHCGHWEVRTVVKWLRSKKRLQVIDSMTKGSGVLIENELDQWVQKKIGDVIEDLRVKSKMPDKADMVSYLEELEEQAELFDTMDFLMSEDHQNLQGYHDQGYRAERVGKRYASEGRVCSLLMRQFVFEVYVMAYGSLYLSDPKAVDAWDILFENDTALIVIGAKADLYDQVFDPWLKEIRQDEGYLMDKAFSTFHGAYNRLLTFVQNRDSSAGFSSASDMATWLKNSSRFSNPQSDDDNDMDHANVYQTILNRSMDMLSRVHAYMASWYLELWNQDVLAVMLLSDDEEAARQVAEVMLNRMLGDPAYDDFNFGLNSKHYPRMWQGWKEEVRYRRNHTDTFMLLYRREGLTWEELEDGEYTPIDMDRIAFPGMRAPEPDSLPTATTPSKFTDFENFTQDLQLFVGGYELSPEVKDTVALKFGALSFKSTVERHFQLVTKAKKTLSNIAVDSRFSSSDAALLSFAVINEVTRFIPNSMRPLPIRLKEHILDCRRVLGRAMKARRAVQKLQKKTGGHKELEATSWIFGASGTVADNEWQGGLPYFKRTRGDSGQWFVQVGEHNNERVDAEKSNQS